MLLNSGVIDSQLINTSYVVEYVGNTLKSKNDVLYDSGGTHVPNILFGFNSSNF